MSKASVFRRENFNAAHRLHVKQWTQEENEAFFGKYNNPLFYGHNYTVEVKVTGIIDPVTGYVIDKRFFGKTIRKVISELDHRNLNLDVAAFNDVNPTIENIAIFLYNRLQEQFDTQLEIQIRLYETDNNFVEYPA